jgi:uncharacterized membrane protein
VFDPTTVRSVRGLVTRLEQGFWFIPSLVALPIGLLAVVLTHADRAIGSTDPGVVFDGGPDAARAILTTIAASLITIAGLTFSLLIVTLQLVSGQFTPRLIRNFLSDRVNQVIAGAFVGIFLYCLLVLRSVRSEGEGPDGDAFVPALALTVAIALGLAGLVLLLVFIHHAARSVQIATIVARTGETSREAIDRGYPDAGEPLGDKPGALVERWEADARAGVVRAGETGYVSRIDLDGIADAIAEHADRLQVLVAPGDHVTRRTQIAAVWPARAVDERGDAVRALVQVASERTIGQDTLFGVRQLADVALRAVSPGINDPTTAVNCLGQMRDILEGIASRESPVAVRSFPKHGVTLVVKAPAFADYVETAFMEIGRYAKEDPRVMAAVLHALEGVASAVREDGPPAEAVERLEAIATVADRLVRRAVDAAEDDTDRRALFEPRARLGEHALSGRGGRR